MRERHYPRECLVLRVSRLRVLPVYVYCPFVVYTCLQSTSPHAVPTPLRFTTSTSPHESLRVARRLSITSFELPRYTTPIGAGGQGERHHELLRARIHKLEDERNDDFHLTFRPFLDDYDLSVTTRRLATGSGHSSAVRRHSGSLRHLRKGVVYPIGP